jgi:hypothetical protein
LRLFFFFVLVRCARFCGRKFGQLA